MRHAAHDLRAPLRRIAAFAGFLREDAGDGLNADAQRDISHILDGVAELEALVDGLTELALASCQRLELRQVSLADCLEEAIDGAERRFPAPVVELAGEATVRADQPALVKACGGLLEEAARLAGGADALEIFVETERDGAPRVRIVVAGAPPEDDELERLFQPFRKTARDRLEPGLRLAAGVRAMERMGGRLRAERSDASLALLLTLPPANESSDRLG